MNRHQQHTKVALDKLDQQLATLVLHFYATLEKEMDLHARRVSDEERFVLCCSLNLVFIVSCRGAQLGSLVWWLWFSQSLRTPGIACASLFRTQQVCAEVACRDGRLRYLPAPSPRTPPVLALSACCFGECQGRVLCPRGPIHRWVLEGGRTRSYVSRRPVVDQYSRWVQASR